MSDEKDEIGPRLYYGPLDLLKAVTARADAAEAEVERLRAGWEQTNEARDAAVRAAEARANKAEAERVREKAKVEQLIAYGTAERVRADALAVEVERVTKLHNECHDDMERYQAEIARLTHERDAEKWLRDLRDQLEAR